MISAKTAHLSKDPIFGKTAHLSKDPIFAMTSSPQRHDLRKDVISANVDLHSIGTMMGFHAVTLWQN
jgi:hypothetical protein